MKALMIDAPGSAAVVDRPEPTVGRGEVLVRVARAGLCGTDLSTFLGKNPLVTYPRVIGHEIAGVVASAGAAVPNLPEGTAVAISPYKNCGRCIACLHRRPNACRNNQTLGVQREGALAELVAVPAERLYTSAALDLDHLALVEPFSIGMHAVRRGRVSPDDSVLVIGCGGVGAGAVAAAASRGARVFAIDLDEAKLQLAKAFGAVDACNSASPSLPQWLSDQTNGEGPDVVIEAVGTAATYRLALEVVASCGRVVCLGWVKGDVALEARHIVAKEMEILGSRNATDEFADVIALFESRAIDPLRLVTHRVTLDAAPTMLTEWARQPAAVGKVLVTVTP
jgi:threonine dehydrogenase-like Zn-dependent dehydrogenase